MQTTRRMPRCHSLVPVHVFRSSLYLEYQSGFLSMEACSTAVEGLVCPVKSPFYLMFCYIRKGECVVCMKRRPRFEISTRMSSFAETLFRTTIFRGGAYELPTILYIIYNIGRNNKWLWLLSPPFSEYPLCRLHLHTEKPSPLQRAFFRRPRANFICKRNSQEALS